jgi:hypothetical protein
MNILSYLYIFNILLLSSSSYRLSPYETAIGRWKLLYTDNYQFNSKNVDMCIEPDENQIKIRIKRYEHDNLVTIKKVILCTIQHKLSDDIPIPINNGEICTLILLKSQKFIKSIGIFEFPYFALNYKTGMYPKYEISWKYNPLLGRLYIYIDNHTYVFDRKYYDKFTDKQDNITMNTFIIANFVSFLFGKLLEKTIHLQ